MGPKCSKTLKTDIKTIKNSYLKVTYSQALKGDLKAIKIFYIVHSSRFYLSNQNPSAFPKKQNIKLSLVLCVSF